MKIWYIAFALVPWALAGLLFINEPLPFEDLGGDVVVPEKVSPGGVITVIRSRRILRDVSMRVSRSMVKGDCQKSCEILDLPVSVAVLKPGDNYHAARDHVIPPTATPGKWQLIFIIHWDDVLGRERSWRMKELTIEVVR